MKYTILTFIIAGFIACSIGSCKNDKPVNVKTEEEIYGEMEKQLDSLITQSAQVLSIDRIKKMAGRIKQIGSSEGAVLDTLPGNGKISFKKVDGRLEFYIDDAISTSLLYSTLVKESLSGEVVALELYENERRRNCEHWRTVCNDPEKTFTHEQKLECIVLLKLWCN